MSFLKRAALWLLASACAAFTPIAANAQTAASAISSTIASATTSSSFTPTRNWPFHVLLTGTAVASCYLERQLDGTTWSPITISAAGTTTTLYQWSYTGSTLSEDVVESQAVTPYRVDCGSSLGSYTSGTLTVKFSD